MNCVQGCERLRAVEIRGADVLEVVERSPFAPPQNQVAIEPLIVGVCATDQELLQGSMVYLRQGLTKLPLVPGHEWVGRILEVGPGVTGLAPGDVVVGECSIGCGRCPRCWDSNYHQCTARFETGVMKLDGALTERMIFPAKATHIVPKGVNLQDAALTEPLAVALRAVERLEVGNRESVLIVGAGVIGLLAVMILRAEGRARPFLLEPSESRRNRGRDLGATPVEPGEHRFDRILEASGTASGVQDALGHLSNGGRAVLVGLCGLPTVPINTDALVVGDQTVIGSLGSPGVWPKALALLAEGRVRPSLLISHQYPLERTAEAFRMACLNPNDVGKVIVMPNGVAHD